MPNPISADEMERVIELASRAVGMPLVLPWLSLVQECDLWTRYSADQLRESGIGVSLLVALLLGTGGSLSDPINALCEIFVSSRGDMTMVIERSGYPPAGSHTTQ